MFEVLFCKGYQKLQIHKSVLLDLWKSKHIIFGAFTSESCRHVPVYPEWCYSLFYFHQCYLLLWKCWCMSEFIFLSICVNYVSFAEEESVEVAAW